MNKSRRRKKSAQQKGETRRHQTMLHEKTPLAYPKSRWERIRDLPVFWVIGLVAALLAIAISAYDAIREPEIENSQAQTEYPFSVRFSLHNPSIIFSMYDMKLNCSLEKVDTATIHVRNITVTTGTTGIIPPNKTVEYWCPFQAYFFGSGYPIQATITIEAEFKTLGIKRTTKSEVFNWDSQSRQWTKGETVN